MKKIIKLLIICIMLSLVSGCDNNNSEDETLPMEISQDDWASSKKYVELKTGIKMAYVEMGDPNGEVVILQHGMTDNSRSWSLAAPYFTEAGYHVYLPDLRGMGKSDKPDGYYTTITYATDMEAFFEAMNIDKAIVIGHSLGSFTVQTFALMFPERCSKVVLVSSIPIKDYQGEGLIRICDAYVEPLKDDEHPSDDFMDLWYDCTFKEDNAEEVEFDKCLNGLKAESKELPKNVWKNIILGMAATNFKDIYCKFDTSIPVLVLHGDDDSMTKTEYQEELIELLNVDEYSYKNYLGVGHNIQFEIPNESSNDIITWLKTGKLPE